MVMEEGKINSVEKIVDVYVANDGVRYFRIKWRDTWEPEIHLIACDDILEQFWEKKNAAIKLGNCDKARSTKSEMKKEVAEDITSINISKYEVLDHNEYTKVKNKVSDKCTQFSGIIKMTDAATQYIGGDSFKKDISTQFVPQTLEIAIQNVMLYQDQSSQSENILQKEVSIQFAPKVEDSAFQTFFANPAKYCQTVIANQAKYCQTVFANQDKYCQTGIANQDKYCQHETDFSDCCDGKIFQKEISVQFGPNLVHRGIQHSVNTQDRFSQYDDIFLIEVACQINPNSVCCGTQKDVLLQNKYSQCDTNIVQTDVETTRLSGHETQKYLEESTVASQPGTQEYTEEGPGFFQLATQKYTQDSPEIPQLKTRKCLEETSQLETQKYMGEGARFSKLETPKYTEGSPGLSQLETQKYVEDIPVVSQLETQKCTEESNRFSQPETQRFAEGSQIHTQQYADFIEDQPLDFNTTKNTPHKNEKLFSAIKEEELFKEMIFVADIPSQKNCDPIVSSTNEFSILNGSKCILLSTADGTILDSKKCDPSSTLLRSPAKCGPSANSQLANEEIARFQKELVQLNQPSLVDGITNTPVSGRKRLRSESSTYSDKHIDVSYPTPIMSHTIKTPTSTRKDSSTKNKQKRLKRNSNDKKNCESGIKNRKKRNKNKNVVCNDPDNSEILVDGQILDELYCSPCYDPVSPTYHNNDVSPITLIAATHQKKEGSPQGNSKLSNEPPSQTNKLPSWEGKDINEDFIFKYWK